MASELLTRTISGVVLAAAALALTVWSVESFSAMCVGGGIILMKEWWGLTKHRGAGWICLGILYVLAAMIGLIYLRYTNINIALAVFAIVWGGDTAAYIIGKRFGKHKIAPTISPGKSWEGLAASVVASTFIAAMLGHVAPIPHAILGALLAILGLTGDMFESSVKRHAGVKDSGKLIPGHGGLFDRVDALLPCAIFSAGALYARMHF